MPGEYGEAYGEWSFDCLNAEGYVAETAFSDETGMAKDGYAAIYRYADSQKESKLELHTAVTDKVLKEISVGFSLKINGSDGFRLSLAADIDHSDKQLLSYEIAEENASVYCEGEQIYELKINKWNRYVISFYPEEGTFSIYIDSELIKTVDLSDGENSRLNKLSFIFRSAKFEGCYAIDDVAIIY